MDDFDELQPGEIPADALTLLLDRARNGEQAAQNRLIELSIPLARWCAGWYAHNHDASWLFDDLVSVGYMTLVLKCRRLPAEIDSFSGMLVTEMRFAMQALHRKSPTISYPKSWRGDRLKQVPLSRVERLSADPRAEPTMRDSLLRACRTRRERDVIRLRAEGRRDREVGEILGLSTRTVNRIRSRVKDRLDND